MSNFQRVGATSNAHAGEKFEQQAHIFFQEQSLDLDFNYKIKIGIHKNKKLHAFDLGSTKHKIIVECKSHKWTSGHNIPSAKLTIWNEAMYYFLASPKDYRKIFFVLRDERSSNGETLAEYYIKTYKHLIPNDVEIWEYDSAKKTATSIYPALATTKNK